MSRFADKLKDALQVAPPAIGFFRSATQSNSPRMLLVPQIGLEDAETTPDMMKGSDVVLLTCTKAISAKTMKVLIKATGDISWGVRFTGKPQLKPMEGVDFRVCAFDDAMLLGGDDASGNVLIVPLELPDNLARTLNDLPIESVLVDISTAGILTWKDLMHLRRLGDLLAKPFLTLVSASVSEKEIKVLWDAGVDALVVALSSENQTAFNKLRDNIGGISLTTKRKWMKTRAIVPVIKHEEPCSDAGCDDDCGDDE